MGQRRHFYMQLQMKVRLDDMLLRIAYSLAFIKSYFQDSSFSLMQRCVPSGSSVLLLAVGLSCFCISLLVIYRPSFGGFLGEGNFILWNSSCEMVQAQKIVVKAIDRILMNLCHYLVESLEWNNSDATLLRTRHLP
ncbi:hypothetical protein MLD38_025623 [Melastoma candidum]|uniref:Uncharacterized protein n=1 Tax=Melastoma candidum TaxID=119954 RepID=A0ACB9NWW4_9MYRT|nr:hypothetical protein MLD38_025623 [Melastoma candidum]